MVLPLLSFPSTSTTSVILRRNPSSYKPGFTKIIRSSPFTCRTSSTCESAPEQFPQPNALQTNYGGLQFAETVGNDCQKSRLDSWISSHIPNGISRARVQSSIRSGLVTVNGRIITKASHVVKVGDMVNCTISELQPLRADPEDMPLDIIYEDAHVLVVNKPAHMVVHPAPGHASGTLVNGILHHCKLPTIAQGDMFSVMMDCSDDEFISFSMDQNCGEDVGFNTWSSIRPGIVHRLDKGTSGLLVVAKDEHSHAHLSQQFKLHTIHRVYVSLTCGVPSPSYGRIDVPIARDLNNRIRMAAVSNPNNHRHARHAASRYKVIEVLAGGGSALMEWGLETGRTHQIRAHAKYLGIPLLGDEVYGGTKSMALSLLLPKTPPTCHSRLSHLVSNIQRPCLHATCLGFKHPQTGKHMQFSCSPPHDFVEVLRVLRDPGTDKLMPL